MNIDLGKTQITDKVRVSSAAIFYEEYFGSYYQYETLVFSTDERQEFEQHILGSSSGGEPHTEMMNQTRMQHEKIANDIWQKFN